VLKKDPRFRREKLCLEGRPKSGVLGGNVQFLSDNLLHDVAGHGVEDVEQGLVGEAGHFRLQRLDVLHRVAGWDGEVWLDGS